MARGVQGSGRLSLANAKISTTILSENVALCKLTTKTNSACHAWCDVLTFNILKKNLYQNTNISVSQALKRHRQIDKANWQRELCAHAGFKVEEYDSKTLGTEEVKVFAQLLAPKYGIAVHNSLMDNSKIFETSTTFNKQRLPI